MTESVSEKKKKKKKVTKMYNAEREGEKERPSKMHGSRRMRGR